MKLIENTIDKQDIDALREWLSGYPHLTKGELTIQFEEEFAKWQGIEYAVFVNSGSSANLLMAAVLKELGYKEINIPRLCWSTSITPFLQLGFEVNTKEINRDFKLQEASEKITMAVHPLGFIGIFNYDNVLCEDCCESIGSYNEKGKVGNNGLMSSFSFYFGHHISTIEGGMVCTNDKRIYNLLLMLRSHGWDRDLQEDDRNLIRGIYNVDDFRAKYMFYYQGYNLRNTDIGAFLGLRQLKKLDDIIEKRFNNLKLYDKLIKNDYWKISWGENEMISNFAYPIIHPKKKQIIEILNKNNIECRPIIAGNIDNHPMLNRINYCIDEHYIFTNLIHAFGIYVPNHPFLKENDIKQICDVINGVIN